MLWFLCNAQILKCNFSQIGRDKIKNAFQIFIHSLLTKLDRSPDAAEPTSSWALMHGRQETWRPLSCWGLFQSTFFSLPLSVSWTPPNVMDRALRLLQTALWILRNGPVSVAWQFPCFHPHRYVTEQTLVTWWETVEKRWNAAALGTKHPPSPCGQSGKTH